MPVYQTLSVPLGCVEANLLTRVQHQHDPTCTLQQHAGAEFPGNLAQIHAKIV